MKVGNWKGPHKWISLSLSKPGTANRPVSMLIPLQLKNRLELQ